MGTRLGRRTASPLALALLGPSTDSRATDAPNILTIIDQVIDQLPGGDLTR